LKGPTSKRRVRGRDRKGERKKGGREQEIKFPLISILL